MKLATTVTVALLFSGCMHIEHKNSTAAKKSSKMVSLSNSGTICLKKANPNALLIKYYPLSTSCASSSLYDWKLNGFDINKVGNSIKIDSYSLYKKIDSQMATKDCAGAKVVTKKISIKDINSIYWGKTKLPNSISSSSTCYKKEEGKIKRVKPFKI